MPWLSEGRLALCSPHIWLDLASVSRKAWADDTGWLGIQVHLVALFGSCVYLFLWPSLETIRLYLLFRQSPKAQFLCKAEDQTLKYGDFTTANSPSLVSSQSGLCGQLLYLLPTPAPPLASDINRRV